MDFKALERERKKKNLVIQRDVSGEMNKSETVKILNSVDVMESMRLGQTL